MLGIILKILSIAGIVFLTGLALVLLCLLLLFFFPFTYRLQGCKDETGLRLTARVNWLFGLFRVRFLYPEPGRLTARILWFSLFDMKIPPEKDGEETQKKSRKTLVKKADEEKADSEKAERKKESKGDAPPVREKTSPEERLSEQEAPGAESACENPHEASGERRQPPPDPENLGPADQEDAPESGTGLFGKISQKIRKIKYTIYNLYDKIKEIWENISYYTDLLREENTKQLASHALRRGARILKSIRPRRMKVQLLFGMDSPDTTGCLYGAYCVLSAALGPDFQVVPDFQQKRLEGTFDIAGRVVVWVFVINGLKVLLDKKLRLFLKKVKAGRKAPKKAAA
ncbi:MAG: hypothetical protein HFH93_14175 [Lachnospiraceae bacterium]|nr:hypothetical protein [Lachnospiraceae bacterium]